MGGVAFSLSLSRTPYTLWNKYSIAEMRGSSGRVTRLYCVRGIECILHNKDGWPKLTIGAIRRLGLK